jgi:hypothetical protein
MQYYANLCAPYAEKNATLTIDLPAEDMDQFMELVHILKEEKNLSARRAFTDMVKYTYEHLMQKDYDRKNRKNAKRGRRNR